MNSDLGLWYVPCPGKLKIGIRGLNECCLFYFKNPLGEANSARNFLTLSNLNIVCWRKVTEEEETKQIQTDKEIKRN